MTKTVRMLSACSGVTTENVTWSAVCQSKTAPDDMTLKKRTDKQMVEKVKKEAMGVILVDVDNLGPSFAQPRRWFDDEKIRELASSIVSNGILQPLIVRKTSEQAYEIIAGERRWRAARQAGLTHVPCIVMSLVDEKALAVALIENVQREDLNPIEEALAYQRLKDTLAINQEEVASMVGKDRASVANILRLLRLPKGIQSMVLEEAISMGHARALLALDSQDMMMMVAQKIIREGLSVRRCEAIIRSLKLGANFYGPLNNQALSIDPHHREVEQKLSYAIGTRVRLKKSGAGFVVVIHFPQAEQLNGMLDLLGVEI